MTSHVTCAPASAVGDVICIEAAFVITTRHLIPSYAVAAGTEPVPTPQRGALLVVNQIA